MNKIRLGKCIKENSSSYGEAIYLSKHEWSCDWYWGFGYIGNKNLHTHFDTTFLNNFETNIGKCLTDTKINQNDWWILLDLFKQAYTLKNAYGLYHVGNSNISGNKKSMVIPKNQDMIDKLKNDLENVLNVIWGYLVEINNRLE